MKIILSVIFLISTFIMGKKLQLYLDIDSKEIDDLYQRIARNVKKNRLKRNITQSELAFSIGYKSVSTIGKIEAGLENKHYNIENLYKIANVLDMDISEFFN